MIQHNILIEDNLHHVARKLENIQMSYKWRWNLPEPADEEQHDADADVGEDDAHPDLVGQREQEREDARRLLGRFRYHDADAEAHKRLREVDSVLSHGRDRERRDGQVGLL